MNVDTLSGRDLDAMVAQHVFGYVVEPGVNVRTDEKDYVQRTPSGRDWARVASYSASTSASITVEVEVKKRGWKRRVPPVNERGEGTVVLEHTDGRTVEAFGAVYEALCRAALKAMA